jgi:hypothetical protein
MLGLVLDEENILGLLVLCRNEEATVLMKGEEVAKYDDEQTTYCGTTTYIPRIDIFTSPHSCTAAIRQLIHNYPSFLACERLLFRASFGSLHSP